MTFEYANARGVQRAALSSHDVMMKIPITCENYVVHIGDVTMVQVKVDCVRDEIPVRLISAKLRPPSGYDIMDAMENATGHVLFPEQSTNYVYKLKKRDSSTNDTRFEFDMQFRPLEHGKHHTHKIWISFLCLELYYGIKKALVNLSHEYYPESGESQAMMSQESLVSKTSLSSFSMSRYLPFLTHFIYAHSLPSCAARVRSYNMFGLLGKVKLVPPPPWQIKPMQDNIVIDSDLIELVGHKADWWTSLDLRLLKELQRADALENSAPRKRRHRLVMFLGGIVLAFYEVCFLRKFVSNEFRSIIR